MWAFHKTVLKKIVQSFKQLFLCSIYRLLKRAIANQEAEVENYCSCISSLFRPVINLANWNKIVDTASLVLFFVSQKF